MKLFQVYYRENEENDSYLAIGEDTDNNKTITERETSRLNCGNSLCYINVREIAEVDGHKIIVE